MKEEEDMRIDLSDTSDTTAQPTISVDDLLGVISRLRAVCEGWHSAVHDGPFEDCTSYRCKRARG